MMAGLLFSLAVSYELFEQPFELLDSELDMQAHTMLAGLISKDSTLLLQGNSPVLTPLGRLYWLKIFDQHNTLVYASAMTKFTEIPLKKEKDRYNVSSSLPEGVAALDRDDSDRVTFRVRVFPLELYGKTYLVQIARPMEHLQEEIVEMIISIIIGLFVFMVALVVFGHYAAGKILRPIRMINALATDISDKNLDQRIPLGKNKDELHILSSSLNSMLDRLQFSFKQQKEFIANASHELKTPIAMQRLFFDEALQRSDLPDDFRTNLSNHSSILLRMDQLVKKLLNLSALELKQTVQLKPVNLSSLAADVLIEFEEILRKADISLTANIEEGIVLHADQEKVRRMLINLLDNALKYNRQKNGEIRFSLATAKQELAIEVYNTGQGIPANALKDVFKQFYRVEKSRSRMLGGSGLGLTIVQRIVELHHGRIAITSEYGSWTRVRIELPYPGASL